MPSFYQTLVTSRQDSHNLQDTIKTIGTEVVCRAQGLNPVTRKPDPTINTANSSDRPGMILGQVQSGKTRTFIGVIAYAFDHGFDVSVVFTKNSTALVEQTVKRLESDFKAPADSDHLFIYDIMKISSLTTFMLQGKLILVVKKEVNNLKKLNELFSTTFPQLAQKSTLVIDDEADSVSVGYYSDKSTTDGKRFATIAEQISDFRDIIRTPNAGGQSGTVSFMQVTATPYSLYLQPENISLNNIGYRPLRPAYSFVLTPHQNYVGGYTYFEESLNPKHYASDIYVPIHEIEFSSLIHGKSKSSRKPSDKLRQNILTTPKLQGFREALFRYLIAGTIRILQEAKRVAEQEEQAAWVSEHKSAFLIHIDMGKNSHVWQSQLVDSFLEQITQAQNRNLLYTMVDQLLPEFALSISRAGFFVPSAAAIKQRLLQALQGYEINARTINSDDDIINLLNTSGQLRLDAPYNIFIGGQSLDRGITIDHLIGFFYGRNPKKFQMDTVLQHARMYGARSKADMSVTRFYTSHRIYQSLEKMYYFDKALRDGIERDKNIDTPVVFLQKDPTRGQQIIPCSPTRIALSDIQTFHPGGRLLPVGFDVKSKTKIKKSKSAVDAWVSKALVNAGSRAKLATDPSLSRTRSAQREQWTASVDEVKAILDHIDETFDFSGSTYQSNIDVLKHAISNFADHHDQLRVHYVGFSNIGRLKKSGFQNAPDDGQTTRPQARQDSQRHDCPVLMLIHVKGEKSKGWSGIDFYWPVLLLQNTIQTHIFSRS